MVCDFILFNVLCFGTVPETVTAHDNNFEGCLGREFKIIDFGAGRYGKSLFILRYTAQVELEHEVTDGARHIYSEICVEWIENTLSSGIGTLNQKPGILDSNHFVGVR